jgi:hypothetical protein
MTTTATVPLAGMQRTQLNSIVFASCFGTIIEWYDFLICATAAALVFNKAFFPAFDPLAGSLAALGSYAFGFVARPLAERRRHFTLHRHHAASSCQYAGPARLRRDGSHRILNPI